MGDQIAYMPYRYGNWGYSTELFAFDVTTPSQPKFASHFNFGEVEAWNVGVPLAAHDAVYLSYKVLPSDTRKLEPLAAGAPDPVNRYFLKVIDYSDSSAPVAAQGGVNLPGELRALGQDGSLLYTVGPLLNPADGSRDGTGCALHVSGFDGAAAHLLDQLPLPSVAQPFLVSGDALLVLRPQPPQLWAWDQVTNRYTSGSNPAHTSLDTYSLGDDGKFSKPRSLTLDHELSLGQVHTLGVLRSNDRTIRLLDLANPLNPTDLGVYFVEGNGGSSLSNADGDAQRGLWLPLGQYGVDVISLAP
jgi:hypothetical protein